MNRNAIIEHIDLWKARLGSYNKVAEYCRINVGALSTILRGKYKANESAMLQKIAKALDFKENSWQIVRSITDYRIVEALFWDAKQESMWFPIANKAGSGKTAPLEDLYNRDTTGSVFFIKCEEWNASHFLKVLLEKLKGEAKPGPYKTIADLAEEISNYFNEMSLERPILLLDQFDKLKPAAKRTLIPIFNRTEDKLGLIAAGTEAFEKEMQSGVRLRKNGYDELDSRFGRRYIHLNGITEAESNLICAANGVTDKEVQFKIWSELPKEEKPIRIRTTNGEKTQMVLFADDKRRLKRVIKREALILQSKRKAA